MALTAKVLTGTLSSTLNGTTDFTSSGFGTPDAALVFISNAGSGTNPASLSGISIGFWDGTDQYCAAIGVFDNVDITDASRARYTNAIGAGIGGGETVFAIYTLSSVTDGVRLTLTTDNTSISRAATVILLKGLTNAKVTSITSGNTTSAQDFTGLDFQPDLVFVLGSNRTGTGIATFASLSFGVAHNASTGVVQGSVGYYDSDNTSSSVRNNSVNDDCAERLYWGDGFINRKTVLSGFDSQGFTFTQSEATTAILDVLCLKLPNQDDAFVGIKDSATDTGTEAYTGTGFEPVLLGLFGNTDTAVNSTSASPTGAMSFGWADGTTEQSIITGSEDELDVSNVFSRYDASNVLNLRFDDDTVDAVASLDSFDSDGFTLDYSDASANARKMLVVALGNSATVSLPTLSAPTLISAGGNTYQPRVTATYS